MKGVQCHTSVMTMEISATPGFDSQGTGSRPTVPKAQLIGPAVSLNRMYQMTPTMVGVMTIGVSSAARASERARNSRCMKIAMTKPSVNSTAVAVTAKTIVRPTERRKGASLNSDT